MDCLNSMEENRSAPSYGLRAPTRIKKRTYMEPEVSGNKWKKKYITSSVNSNAFMYSQVEVLTCAIHACDKSIFTEFESFPIPW